VIFLPHEVPTCSDLLLEELPAYILDSADCIKKKLPSMKHMRYGACGTIRHPPELWNHFHGGQHEQPRLLISRKELPPLSKDD
jgi:hypothetical protein